ncbi:hypothetical protein [Nocardioides speluncae]|uniref:hypothetical protein n=1 Tax=Nocardioides speluncae TaxID=2670337 RepID=UPI000D68CA06|nr:hypothetical protein [Nocardioides speluncae]
MTTDDARRLCDPSIPEPHSDTVRQAVARYDLNAKDADFYLDLANRHQDTNLGHLLEEQAAKAWRRAGDAILDAARAVREERAS